MYLNSLILFNIINPTETLLKCHSIVFFKKNQPIVSLKCIYQDNFQSAMDNIYILKDFLRLYFGYFFMPSISNSKMPYCYWVCLVSHSFVGLGLKVNKKWLGLTLLY